MLTNRFFLFFLFCFGFFKKKKTNKNLQNTIGFPGQSLVEELFSSRNFNSLVTNVELTSVGLDTADQKSQPKDVINNVTVTYLQGSRNLDELQNSAAL